MPLEPINAKIERIEELTSTVRDFRFQFSGGKHPAFQAGQFCSIHIPEICGLDPKSGKPLRRAYSIASAPYEEGYLDLCIKRVEYGPGSNWLWQLKKGTDVQVSLPYGKFLMKKPFNYDFIFVATGTGIAPLRSMIRTLIHDKKIEAKITLIFGVRYENEILYEKEWCTLEKEHANFQFIPTVSRPKNWRGETGYAQEKLKKYFADPKGKEIYLCGLGTMVKAVQETAKEIGFHEKQIHFERYD